VHWVILALACKARLVFAVPPACLDSPAYKAIQALTALPACVVQLGLVAIPALVVPVRLVRRVPRVLEASKVLTGLLVAWVLLVSVQRASKAILVLASKALLA